MNEYEGCLSSCDKVFVELYINCFAYELNDGSL